MAQESEEGRLEEAGRGMWQWRLSLSALLEARGKEGCARARLPCCLGALFIYLFRVGSGGVTDKPNNIQPDLFNERIPTDKSPSFDPSVSAPRPVRHNQRILKADFNAATTVCILSILKLL
jgi:hypothetical protein